MAFQVNGSGDYATLAAAFDFINNQADGAYTITITGDGPHEIGTFADSNPDQAGNQPGVSSWKPARSSPSTATARPSWPQVTW